MSRTIARLSFTALALAAGSTVALAQSTTTGSLQGILTDEKGNPIAGAAIRLTSSQITRTEVTSANGSFRFGLLNPIAWRINITKVGMQAINRDIVIQTNNTQVVNFKMAPTASATVEVIASNTATIDTTTTQVGSSFQMDTISALPMGRDMNSIANFTPGVTDSGFSMGASISGASAAENNYVLDGLNTTDSRYGGTGNSLVTDFIEQVEVQTGGFKPEYSALGGVFNAVTKSGSNSFRGSAWMTFDPNGLQASQKENAIAKQAAPDQRYDIGSEVSGPIIKDKLFYFIGVQGDLRTRKGEVNNNGVASSDRKMNYYQTVGKVNWFVNQDFQLTFSGNFNPYSDNQDNVPPLYGTAQQGVKYDGFTMGLNVSADWTISPTMFLSAKVGRFQIQDDAKPVNSTQTRITDRLHYYPGTFILPGLNDMAGGNVNADPALYALSTGFIRGGFGSYTEKEYGTTDQFRADLSWFTGDHNIKMGLSFLSSNYEEVSPQTGGNGAWTLYRSGAFGFTAVQVLYTQSAKVKSEYTAFYLQDTWEITSGLKLAFGARFESQKQNGNDGREFLKFGFGDAIQPRIGLIWDPGNDGKLKLSANFARYYEQIPQRMAMRQRGNEVYLQTYYNLLAYDPNGLGTVGTTVLAQYDYSTPYTNVPIMDGIKLPQRDEVIFGIDHTLPNGWLVGMHAKHREMKNPIEDFTPWNYNTADGGSSVDGGIGYAGMAILGNPGPGVVTWTTLPGSVSNTVPGVSQKMSWNSTFEKPQNIYQSVDLTLDRKTERSYFTASYTWSRLYGNYEGLVSSSNGQSDANITASWDYPIYVGTGTLPLDRTHQIKVSGSYNWDLAGGRFTAGGTWSYRTGTPLSQFTTVQDVRTLDDDGNVIPGGPTEGIGVGNWTIPGSRIPTVDYGGYNYSIPADFRLGQFGRTPATNMVDLRFEYTVKVGKLSLAPSVDVFNLFNTRKATSLEDTYTDRYGEVTGRWGMETGWQTGRRYRVGLKVRF